MPTPVHQLDVSAQACSAARNDRHRSSGDRLVGLARVDGKPKAPPVPSRQTHPYAKPGHSVHLETTAADGVLEIVDDFRVLRLSTADRDLARVTFRLMVEVFGEEPAEPLTDDYIDLLLEPESFWAMAAVSGTTPVGGLTAHTLTMTRSQSSELFIYDLAVHPNHRRKGVGAALVSKLRVEAMAAGIQNVFVPAEADDQDAVSFYEAQHGDSEAVTIFTFRAAPSPP